MLLRVVLALPNLGQLDAFAEPWRRLYAHSALLPTVVLFGHLGGLLAAGSLSVAANRATLRIDEHDGRARRLHLEERARLHRPVAIALAVAMGNGALLFLADVEAFAASWIFWAKMTLVLAMIANAVLAASLDARLRGARADDATLWRRRRACALTSGALWFVLVLAGAALATR
jgi:hypothetical protein